MAPQPGERILELGAGTGAALVALAQAAGPAGTVAGVDLSPGMCRVAAARLANTAVSTAERLNADILCGDATRISAADAALDALFMSFTLELFDDHEIPAVLAECRRVLRPSGRICVVAMAQPDHAGAMSRLYGWAHARFPVAIDCRPIALSQILPRGNFRVERRLSRSLWGLPVEVALARPASLAKEIK